MEEERLQYEITIILSGGLSGEREKELLAELKKTIAGFDGEVEKEERMGLKELAYPIKKDLTGIYYFFILKLPSSTLSKFDRELRLIPGVIRHLLVRRLRLSNKQLKFMVFEKKQEEGESRKTKPADLTAEEKKAVALPKEAPSAPPSSELDEEQKRKLEGKLKEILKE